jgi:HAMP domain-containing protein
MKESNNGNKYIKQSEIEPLRKQVENMTMALRVSQALLQQILPQVQSTKDEIASLSGALSDLRYYNKALLNHFKIDSSDEHVIVSMVDVLKAQDWQQASDKDDVDSNLAVIETLSSKEDVAMFSTKLVTDPFKGIFRSKIALSELQDESLINSFLGKTVGEVFNVKFNNVEHVVTLLGARSLPK